MKGSFVGLLCAMFLLPASTAEAEMSLDVMAGVGMNMCMDSGDAKCDEPLDMGASGTLLLAPGLKFTDYLGLYLDFQYGWLSPDIDDASASTLHLMPTVRGLVSLGVVEVFGGLGVGYSQVSMEIGSNESSWSNLLNFKATAGATYPVLPTLSIGVNLDYVINMNESGEVCLKSSGSSEQCKDQKSDVPNLMQVSLIAKMSF